MLIKVFTWIEDNCRMAAFWRDPAKKKNLRRKTVPQNEPQTPNDPPPPQAVQETPKSTPKSPTRRLRRMAPMGENYIPPRYRIPAGKVWDPIKLKYVNPSENQNPAPKRTPGTLAPKLAPKPPVPKPPAKPQTKWPSSSPLFSGLNPAEIKRIKVETARRIMRMRGLPHGTRVIGDPKYDEVLAQTTEDFRKTKERMKKFRSGEGAWHALPGVSQESFPSLYAPPASKQEAAKLMRSVAEWFTSRGARLSPEVVNKAYEEWYRITSSTMFDADTVRFYKNYMGDEFSLGGSISSKLIQLRFAKDKLRWMLQNNVPGQNGEMVPPENKWPSTPSWLIDPQGNGLTKKLMSQFLSETTPASATLSD